MSQTQDRVLALSGIFQAARLAQQLSRKGSAEAAPFGASVRSILRIDAPDTAAVYGGARGVALGLRLLRDRLGDGAKQNDLEAARYVVSLLQLEAALRRRPDMLGAIRQGIDTINSTVGEYAGDNEEDDAVPPQLVEKLAELYTRTLSRLSPRIMVTGEQGYLANPQIAASVRAALFAGIRSAVLWRQLGGNRWQLLLARRRLAAEAGAQLAALRLH